IGRQQRVHLGSDPAAVWEQAIPRLRGPIKRVVWARPNNALRLTAAPKAGLTALAEYTSIAAPEYPVHAVSHTQWLAATRKGLDILPEPEPRAIQWQIWAYAPLSTGSGRTVDPLSLTLSLQSDSDDRVLIALDELKEQFPWSKGSTSSGSTS